MPRIAPWFIVLLVGLLSGCSVRSISDSGYDSGRQYGRTNAFYQGELNEFDVLGIDRGGKPSDQEIADALANRQLISLRRASRVMLIQSGAILPDDSMTRALQSSYSIVPFTGVPASTSNSTAAERSAESYSRSLRLAAARSGCEKIVVYWGMLESARENLATSTVSWVPIVGWVLPDERQQMRIRLKIAIVDVKTGQWEIYLPDPQADRDYSSIVSRRDTDQSLVAALKEKAYLAAASDLQKRYDR